MKQISFIICITLIVSCTTRADLPVCPALYDTLCKYMQDNDYKSYYLTIINLDSTEFLTITGLHAYDKDFVDGYFFMNNHLVVYCFLDKKNRPDIIYQGKTFLFSDSIKGYQEITNVIASFEPHPNYYKIYSPECIMPLSYSLLFRKNQKVTINNDVIKNADLNESLYSYINKYLAPIYEMSFIIEGGKTYLYIRGAYSLDPNLVDGYFYYNNNLVIIYNERVAIDFNLFDNKLIKKNIYNINNVRFSQYRLHPDYPYTDAFQIKDSLGNLLFIPDSCEPVVFEDQND